MTHADAGGAYLRDKDGALRRVEHTAEAGERAAPAAAPKPATPSRPAKEKS